MKAIVFLSFCLFCLACVPDSSQDQGNTDEEGLPTSYVETNVSPRRTLDRRDPATERFNISPSRSAEAEKQQVRKPVYAIPYNLMREDEVLYLPDELKTIGGLSMSIDQQRLIAVNGQEGTLFFLDKKTGTIEEKVELKKRGDFESVEAVGEAIYLAKKNGTLVQVTDFWNEKPAMKNYNTSLSGRNEVEGLTFDPENNELLLACKGKAGDGGILEDGKAIYVFQLDKMELLGQPMYLLTGEAIVNYMKGQDMDDDMADIVAQNYPSEAYSPSCIALHPHSNELYILSSEGKLLIVINKSSKVTHMEVLDSFIFDTPNGMCFDSDGTLYISSHGKGKEGRIYRFFKKEVN